MDIGDIIINSFKYPIEDKNNFIHVVLIFSLIAIVSIINFYIMSINTTPTFKQYAAILFTLFISLFFCFLFIAPGYFLSVVHEGVNQTGKIPKIKLGKNIAYTLQLIPLAIVYLIIPVIITVFFASLTGIITSRSYFNFNYGSFWVSLFGYIIIMIVNLIFEAVFGVAVMRFAKNYKLSEGMAVAEVIEDMKRIGIAKLVGTYIILGIIAAVVMYALSFLELIPYLGIIISMLLLKPFFFLVEGYALGLLYSDVT